MNASDFPLTAADRGDDGELVAVGECSCLIPFHGAIDGEHLNAFRLNVEFAKCSFHTCAISQFKFTTLGHLAFQNAHQFELDSHSNVTTT